MGASKSLQVFSKISKTATGAVAILFCILLFANNVQNGDTKSIAELLYEVNNSILEGEEDGPSSTSPSPSSPPGGEGPVILNEANPNYSLPLSSDSKVFRFRLGEEAKSQNFRIAVHLKDCDFSGQGKIYLDHGTGKSDWDCPTTIPEDSKEDDDEDKENSQRHHYNNNLINVRAKRVLDNLEEVSITHDILTKSSDHHHINARARATITINIYKELSDSSSCPKDYFDCRGELCPSRCCSEYSTGGGGSGYRQQVSLNPISDILSLTGKKSETGGRSRCVHKRLVCDGNPSCGLDINFDEKNEVCHPQVYCSNCQTLCLTWNYVLTSLAIAVLFIITPTAIVFALFHRRNVALERERLIRLAQTRMADMRGEFTRDDPINDLPPTYEEVHDIKVPPPCFCQAVAMEGQLDETTPEESEESLKCSCKRDAVEEEKPEPNSDSDSIENSTEVGVDAVREINNNSNSNCDTENK